jgi:hypothetical protein
MEHLTFLLLLLIYLIIPVFLSFQKNVRFVFRLKYLIPATIFSGAIFLMMCWRFTEFGIWNFNNEYLTGIDLLSIPLEVWLSLIIIPFSAAYIYEWLKIRFENLEKANLFLVISLILLTIFVALAYFYSRALFSFFVFFLTAIYLAYTLFRNRFKRHLTKFYLAFLIMLVPFTIVSFIMNLLPVITFDASHIMPVAVLGIPFERFVYLYLMMLINFTIYEYISERQLY